MPGGASGSRTARRVALTLGLAALIAWVLWYALSKPTQSRAAAQPAAALALPAPRVAAETAFEVERELASTATAHDAPAAAPTDPAPELAPKPDRVRMRLRIVNEFAAPVAGATITQAWAHCSAQASTRTLELETTPQQSGLDGVLEVSFPRRFDRHDDVDELSLAIHHVEYASLDSGPLAITPEVVLVLQRGNVLVLSGWIGSREVVVTDVEPHFSGDIEIADSDWLPRRDGRMTTVRVPIGSHLVQLRHWNPEGVWWSDWTEFTVEAGTQTELHLELRRSVTLVGRLDDQVPRPVVDGHVSIAIAVQNPTDASLPGGFVRQQVRAHADGSFEVRHLPAGCVQVIAVCRGWVTPRVLADSPAQAGEILEPGADWESVRGELGDDAWVYPFVDLRALDGVLIVPMQPTGVLELHCTDAQGAPVARAIWRAHPNVQWPGVGSNTISSQFIWSAETDDAGVAYLRDLPAGEHEVPGSHPEQQVPIDPRTGRRSLRCSIRSNETTRIDVVMERCELR